MEISKMENGTYLHEKIAHTNYIGSKKVIASNASKGVLLLPAGTALRDLPIIC